ncbi:MAG: ferrous iron transport protein B [Anaerolineales bacterium]|nr:ferrous iron transport protein B [Anaerolineales bacterium]
MEAELSRITDAILQQPEIAAVFDARWLAIKLLEGEKDLTERVRATHGGLEVLRQAQASAQRLALTAPDGVEIAIADRRYTFVSRVVADVLSKPPEPPVTLSERVDRVVTHPWLSVPIFFLVMYLVFNLVVNVSAPYLDWIDAVFGGPITRGTAFLLRLLNAPAWLRGLLLDGVIVGVGGVLVFLPGLFMLFLFIGLLEDSGYLARAAVVMDRFMSLLGLHGKSFVPLVLGFGCAVPAIYATRTLENRRDRILTAMLIPLMSCSARLPVYVVFGLAFFGRRANLVIWGLYALGILVAAVVGVLFSRTFLKGWGASTFVMELPRYSFPSLRNLWIQVSHRTGSFIRNAGTVILLASVVIWALLNLPLGSPDLSGSWFARISATLAPILRPAGFGSWETTGALLSGLVAKEVVVSTMSQIYVGEERGLPAEASFTFGEELVGIGGGFLEATVEAGKEFLEVLTPGVALFDEGEEGVEDTALRRALKREFTPLSALAFLVFVLLYVPCVATLGTIRGEFGWKWAAIAALWQSAVAWAMAVIVFQVGRLLGYA